MAGDRIAAIHQDVLASDEAGFTGAQPEHRQRHILRLTKPPGRRVADEWSGGRIARQEASEHWRIDDVGVDIVEPNLMVEAAGRSDVGMVDAVPRLLLALPACRGGTADAPKLRVFIDALRARMK